MLLSIIVPVYNKEPYIDLCIQSILNQTFTDFELILINDGSTDASGARCDYYAATDERVKVIHQHNQGVSPARNAGLDVALGSYIGFVDCDDTLDADMYEVLINTAQKHHSDITICGVTKIFPNKVEAYYGTNTIISYNRMEALRGLFRREFPRSVYDKIYKAGLLKNIRFTGSINEDTFFNFLALNKADTIVFNDVLKYNYIIRDSSVSMSKFSSKYMDIIAFSKRIVEICSQDAPGLVPEAKYFDLIANLTLLNTILMVKKESHIEEYRQVAANIKAFSGYVNKESVRKKHRYAVNMFNASPWLYGFLMKIYTRLTDADVAKKK